MKLHKNEIQRRISEKYIPRLLESTLQQYLDINEVLIVYGARQVGKSTMLLHLAQNLIDTYPVYYYSVDKEIDADLQDTKRLLAVLHDDLQKCEKVYVIIDEAQRIKNISLFVKEIYDQKLPIKFILSGSASFAIKSDVKEPLTGRKFEFFLPPLQLHEIFEYQGITITEETQLTSQLEEILSEYMLYGGYPKIYSTKDPDLKVQRLEEIVDTYITRDMAELFDIEDTNSVRKVTSYVAGNIGNLLSIDKIGTLGGVSRYNTEKILNALEKVFILYKVHPLSNDKFKEVSRSPKMYFSDPGLRNAFIGKTEESLIISDIGHIFENTIGIQLINKYKLKNVNYWRNNNQTEVDFVVSNKSKLTGYEVKYDWKSEKKPRSLRSFEKRYNAHGVVIDKSSYWRCL